MDEYKNDDFYLTGNDEHDRASIQVGTCDCDGSMSEPWKYCDDCQEAREILEEATL